MSTLLDALRRAKQADPAAPEASGGERPVEANLSTLGYSRRRPIRVLRLAIGGVMNSLLDSLRRAKQVDLAAPEASGGERPAETLLSTLGYSPRQRRVRVLRLAIGGVGVASVALLGWVIWERSASMPLGTQVAADLSSDDAGSPGAGPGRAGRPVAGGDPVPAPAPAADTQGGRDAPVTGPGDPAPVVSESGADPSPPRLVDTGADVLSAPAAPASAESPAGATTAPVDPVDAVPRPVEPPGPDESAGSTTRPPADPAGPLDPPPAGSTTRPPADPAGPLDPPPVPIIERGPVVTDVFAAALTLQRTGDIARAVTEYQTLLSEGARSAQAHNNLGLLYQEQNRLDDAAQEYRRAIAIDPRHSKAQNNLGVVRMRQARYEAAAAAFRDARRLDGTNLGAWVNLALALQAAGDPAAARRTLVDALSLDARHAPTHYNLARLFELGGDATRAIEHYRRFVEHSGAEHADLVEIVRRRIAALGGGVPERR